MSNFPDNATGNGLREIEKNGSEMSKPMKIDFFVALKSEISGYDIEKIIREYGFVTKVVLDHDSNEWTCYCTKYMVPCYDDVVEIESQLSSIAKKFGGYIDGFGSFGNVK